MFEYPNFLMGYLPKPPNPILNNEAEISAVVVVIQEGKETCMSGGTPDAAGPTVNDILSLTLANPNLTKGSMVSFSSGILRAKVFGSRMLLLAIAQKIPLFAKITLLLNKLKTIM